MYSIQFSHLAETDLITTLEYIQEVLNSPTAASNLFIEIEKQINRIQSNPYCSALVIDEYLASKGIRSLLAKNYHIFYVTDENTMTISIIRILYARRDWNILLSGEEKNNGLDD